LPWPPPPSSFPVPFARQRSADHTRHAAGTSAYLQAGPPPGNNHPAPSEFANTHIEPRGFQGPSHSGHTSQIYASAQPPPSQPPPIHNSTRPHSNITAPAHTPTSSSTFTTRPARSYEYAPHYPAPPMSGSISQHSANSDPGPPIPARHPPFIATDASGSRPPQLLMTMPVPALSNTAQSRHHHSGSSHPNTVYPPPQSGGPPHNSQGWSYLDQYERGDDSSDSGDEGFIGSQDSTGNSSGYRGQKGPTSDPFAGRRRRQRRRNIVPASSSQPAPPEQEQCRLCLCVGPRHEWANLGHSGFCSERHKWQWEDSETHVRR